MRQQAQEGDGTASHRRRRSRARYRTRRSPPPWSWHAAPPSATTVASANAAPNTAGSVTVPATARRSSWYRIVPQTSTPIKHVVVLFDENESFDHYFGTYPYAANTDGSTFYAKPGTPTVNGLYTDHLEGPGGRC